MEGHGRRGNSVGTDTDTEGAMDPAFNCLPRFRERESLGQPQPRLWKAPRYHDRLMCGNGHGVVALGLSLVALASGWS